MYGHTDLPDRGVTFVGHVPYDARLQQAVPDIRITTTEPVVKEELEHRPTQITLRCSRLIGNTSITPLSQQTYPGRLNPAYDPLLGQRPVDNNTGRDEQRDEPNRARRDSPISATRRQATPAPWTEPRETHEREGNREPITWFSTLPPPRLDTQTWGERERMPQGFSMPAVVPPPNIPIGMKEVDKHYQESMLSRLMQTITQALGSPIRFPEGYKPSLKNDGIT